jgi:hypothetical protein
MFRGGVVAVGLVGGCLVAALWLNSQSSQWSVQINGQAPEVIHTYPVQSFPPYTPPRYSAHKGSPLWVVIAGAKVLETFVPGSPTLPSRAGVGAEF